jgi:hypothetical protein
LKARELLYGGLTCLGRHTISGMLTASSKQFVDWTSAYGLFSRSRIDTGMLFSILQRNILEENKQLPYVVGHLDDTVIKKTGKKIPGTAWRRDALGPRFHTNFIWGQRFMQISLALPLSGQTGPSRAIPVDFHHCPTAVKPKKHAPPQQWELYREEKKRTTLSLQGSLRIASIRKKLDEQGVHDKDFVLSVDGSYTNAQVMKNLPERVTLIGRIRKDTKLYAVPHEQPLRGRKKAYGDRLPTPEQIRQSDKYPWQQVTAWAAGKQHQFNLKVVRDVRWRSAGEQKDLSLLVIRPLGYRLTKSSTILYRDPAYLILTRSDLALEQVLQAYLWRWEIEVNFREEKTLLGCGEEQVRNPNSIEKLPAFTVFMYGMLHLAWIRAREDDDLQMLPRPKWYPRKENDRVTTGDLLNNLRSQLWSKATHNNFSGFVHKYPDIQSLKNQLNINSTAAFYIRN